MGFASELKPGDIKWAAKRLVFKALWNVLPIGAHFQLAKLSGRLGLRIRGVPTHVRQNLAVVFGDVLNRAELDDLACKHVEFQCRTYLTRVLPEVYGFDDPVRWPIQGLENLDQALSRGKGAFLATAHIGYARMIGPILKARGYDAKRIVAKSLAHMDREERWQKWLEKPGAMKGRIKPLVSSLLRREDIPAQLDIRPILSELSKNKPIMVAGDGMRAADFVTIPLLGRPYPFATGFMKIALMTGAAIVPCFVVEGEGHERIKVELEPALALDPKAGLDENLSLFVAVLERKIRQRPHLWFRWSIPETFEKAEQWSKGGAEDRWNQAFKHWA